LIPGAGGDEARASIHPTRVLLRGPQGGEVSWGLDPERSLFFFPPLEPVVIYMKIMLLVGVLAAFPVILWNVWAFVRPGLTDPERAFTARSLQAAMVLFPIGMAFAWFFMTYAMYFMLQYAGGYVPAIGVSSYVNLTLLAMLLMGLVFELPLVILLLMRLDIVRREVLQNHRAYVLVGLLIVSGIVTPPDPFTMVMMAAPLYVLFELTLIVSRLMGIGGTPAEDAAALGKWWNKDEPEALDAAPSEPAGGNGQLIAPPALLPAPEDQAVAAREKEQQ
jgi:sec-independent protein translocase protein TatC